MVWFALIGLVACGDNLPGEGPASIAVTPGDVKVVAGETVEVVARYVFRHATPSAAGDVTWTPVDAAIATVTPGADGHATVRGVKAGTTMIMVTGQGASGVAAVTVLPAVLRSIAITPTVPSVAAGTSAQLTATGTYSDATTADLSASVTWSSSATAIGSVSATGVFAGLTVGGTTITAQLGTISGTASATVTPATLTSIQVTPTSPSLALGTTVQLTATGTFSDATTQDLTSQVTWVSDTLARVTVSTGGLVTAVTLGAATITATLGTTSGSTTVTATAALLASIAITPATPRVARGRTLQLTATGTFTDATTQDLTAQATWTSGTPAFATVSTTGLATALEVGTSTITASFAGVTGATDLQVTAAALESIQVTPASPRIPRGRTQQLTATGTFSDATTQDLTTQVAWASSDATVAQVSNAAGSQGLATALQVGTTTVSATLGGVTGATSFDVSTAVVDTIAVTPTGPSVAKGRTQQLTAIGTFSDLTTQDLTTQVTWTSSAVTIATVSNAAGSNGLAATLNVGTATIRATLGPVSGASVLTVTAAVLETIAVTPANRSLPKDRTLQFTAIGTFSDATTQDLTTQVAWSSTSTTIAQISNAAGSQGLATGVGAGATTIDATLTGVTGSTPLTVTAAVLVSIAVVPAVPSVASGHRLQLAAVGTFSDATTLDLTTQVTWTTGDATIVQVSNAAGSQGLATTRLPGTTTVVAALAGVTVTASFTVTAAVLDSISVTPATSTVVTGGKQPYTATGNFSDVTFQDLTSTVTWASSATAVAQVSNAAGTRGQATGVTAGATTITATLGGVVGSAAITVVGFGVSATLPPDATIDVRTSTPIVVTFNQAIAPVSLTTQTASGACSGSLQLSADGFATCVGFAAAAPTLSAGNTVATATPAQRLSPVVTYRIRVRGTVTTAGGVPIGADITQPTGFVTAGTCAPRMVISQVYGGGGNSGSVFRNDFIELHNLGATPVNLAGSAVQFVSAAGTGTWAVQALPSVTVPAGGYFLIQEAVGANLTAALPTPDFTPTTPVNGTVVGFQIGASSGKVALTKSLTPLTGASCATILALSDDLVGFGAGLSCFEGTGGAAAPANPTAVLRDDGGCDDSNDNGNDFTVAAPLPRNSATSSNQCSCSGSVTTSEPAEASFLDADGVSEIP